MRTRSPTPCALRSRDCANASANPGSSPPWPAPATASTRNRTPGVRERTVDRAPGLSIRAKLTLSYAGFLMLAGVLMLAAAWLAGRPGRSFEFLLQYVPDGVISTIGDLVPGNNSFLLRAFAPAAAIALAFLLVFALPPNPATGPQRRVPRTRRRLRHHAHSARSTRRRTAEIRSQRLPRTAHPTGDHADSSRCRQQRSEPRHR